MKKLPIHFFPETNVSLISLFSSFVHLFKELLKFKRTNQVGNAMYYPSFATSLVWQLLAPFNPGNLGNWSIANKISNNVTGDYEAEVIRMMLDLYQVKNKKKWEGYFTAGATESNIFMAWSGRKSLQKKGIPAHKIVMLTHSLSHYSLTKAADVVGISTTNIAISNEWMGFDSASLFKQLTRLHKSGIRGFLVPFTHGFTLTGTDDDISAILDTIESWGKKHNTHFFFWIDAALAGLVKPFIDTSFLPLRDRRISGMVVDFHKFGHVPIPAGLLLYKASLRKLIEREIPYLSEMDNTLAGSRTGISPVAAWVEIMSQGKQGFRKKIAHHLHQKSAFIKKYDSEKDLTIVTSPTSLTLGIVVHKNKGKWVTHFKETYDIYFKTIPIIFSSGSKNLLMGKAYFTK